MPDRLYSEREVAAIIAQAAEHQRHQDHGPEGPGLTLDEIERAGREAGLDPAALRRAAADLDAGRLGPATVPEGTTVAERWIDGEVPPGAWEDAVADLRLTAGSTAVLLPDTSDVTRLGADQEWTHTGLGGVRKTVTLSPRDDRTRLRVVMSDGGGDARVVGTVVAGVASLLLGMLAGGIAAEGLAAGDLTGVVVLVAVLVAGTVLGTPIVSGAIQKRRQRYAAEAERLADGLARRLAGPQSEPEAAAEPAGAAPALDLSALDPAPPVPNPVAPARRTRS